METLLKDLGMSMKYLPDFDMYQQSHNQDWRSGVALTTYLF